MRIKLILFILFLFYIANPVLAGDPPILTSPANNSTISSIPTFSWQAVSGSTGYNILIDDEPTVISPYAKTPYYPTNPSYSPQTLNLGTYYWKVKAKDSSGNWSSFSSIWSFTLASSTPTPTLTPSPTPSSTQNSAASTDSTSPMSSFTISDIPSQINSDQSFTVQVNLSLANSPSTKFYLKGAFKKPDNSNYFGLVKVGNDWVKNSSKYSEQYPITTDPSGNWSGNLEVKPDTDDSGFTSTDDYIFKVGKYNSTDTNPTVAWSNESTIKIISIESRDQGSISISNTPSSTTNPSTPPKSVKNKALTSSQSKSYDTLVYHISSVAAATASATPSAIAEVKSNKQFNFLPWIGGIFVLAGISSLIFIYLRARKKI